ncbi:Panacea domain-containing protein [Mannheimia haemolytica]|nr:Panacea domain-containing protein [Mannheimia haemolytica]
MFDELKIAQATAYLLHKAGGTMEHIKVMKLLYLADRLSWQRYGYSISNDEDCLSESDTEILEEVFATFGNYKPFALVEYTHNPKYIPEWEDPQGRSKPISLNTLLTKLGKTPSEIESILEQQTEKGEMDNLFKGLINA